MKALALGLGLTGVAVSAASVREPFLVRIQRAESPALEALVQAGETAQLKNRTTGETIELLLHCTSRERDAAFVEVFRTHPTRAYVETMEIVLGERATTQRLPVPITVELISAPEPEISA